VAASHERVGVANNLTPNPFPSGKGNQKKIYLSPFPTSIKPILYPVPLPLGEGVRG